MKTEEAGRPRSRQAVRMNGQADEKRWVGKQENEARRRVEELGGQSRWVKELKGWRSCTQVGGTMTGVEAEEAGWRSRRTGR